jgi:hypothetical protein
MTRGGQRHATTRLAAIDGRHSASAAGLVASVCYGYGRGYGKLSSDIKIAWRMKFPLSGTIGRRGGSDQLGEMSLPTGRGELKFTGSASCPRDFTKKPRALPALPHVSPPRKPGSST